MKFLEGTFSYTLQGFLEANPFVQPEKTMPGGPFRNPTVMFGYLPPEAELKAPSGYYPISEAGYVTFKKDGTFTGMFRVNIGGNTFAPAAGGQYELYGDGTGLLTFLDGETPSSEVFMVIVDPDQEILLMHKWTNQAAGHRRATESGYMKRMV